MAKIGSSGGDKLGGLNANPGPVANPASQASTSTPPVAPGAREVFETVDAVTEVENLIAGQRATMKRSWTAANEDIARLRQQEAVVSNAIREYGATRNKLQDEAQVTAGDGTMTVAAPPDVSFQNSGLSAQLNANFVSYMEQAQKDARYHINTARNKFFGSLERQKAKGPIGKLILGIKALDTKLQRIDADIKTREADRDREAESLRQDADEKLKVASAAVTDSWSLLPEPLLPWRSGAWKDWEPSETFPAVLVGERSVGSDGELGPNSGFGTSVSIPLFVRPSDGIHIVPGSGGLGGSGRDEAQGLVRSMLLRSLAARRPGDLNLTVFDPTGLGQSIAPLLELAEYDRELLGGKVWSSNSDLKEQLAAQTAHMELVIQKYLRSDFETIDEFNAVAEEIAEPYRLVVIFDFPKNFDEESFHELRRIIENGPRCGVSTILVSNPAEALPHGVDLATLPAGFRTLNLGHQGQINSGGYTLSLSLRPDSDAQADPALLKTLVEKIGRETQQGASSVLDFKKAFKLFNSASLAGVRPDLPKLEAPVEIDDPETWWKQTTTDGVASPIGQAGAREVATLTFDSSNHAGALLVGRPGSGKSVLLHSFIAGITTMYSPEELELHLIDFKEGVEFKGYAEYGLPHARSVAIESDREFGLSVLQAINAEVNRRGNLLRSTGGAHSSLQTLRTETGEKLPRILLVFDEFQVLFSKTDKVGNAAAELLESLIRQGRGFGIHVLLASQSLSGLDALGSHVPQLLPVRILLPASENDAMRVLGEGNNGGKLLSKTGEGIFNGNGGAVEANQPFRGSLLAEADRTRHLATLRDLADKQDFVRRPVVFEGNSPLSADEIPVDHFVDEVRGAKKRTLRLRFGAPMAISGSSDIDLRREGGANVMLVARDNSTGAEVGGGDEFSLPRSVASNAVLSALAKGAKVEIADFMAIEEGLEEPLEQFVEAGALNIYRRRQVPALLKNIEAEMKERIDTDDTSAEPVLLVLYGMHRARDFDVESLDFDAEDDLPGRLTNIVTNGPEVGVYVFMWCESLAGLNRRAGSAVVREFSWRLAAQMSADDSHSLIGVDTAHGLRPQQLVVANEDMGVLQKTTVFDQPSADWKAGFQQQVTEGDQE